MYRRSTTIRSRPSSPAETPRSSISPQQGISPMSLRQKSVRFGGGTNTPPGTPPEHGLSRKLSVRTRAKILADSVTRDAHEIDMSSASSRARFLSIVPATGGFKSPSLAKSGSFSAVSTVECLPEISHTGPASLASTLGFSFGGRSAWSQAME